MRPSCTRSGRPWFRVYTPRGTGDRLLGAKLVYGASRDVRGRCHPGAWQNGAQHDFLEVSAFNEESFVQLAGTTIHELAHTLAGAEAGHGRARKVACRVLG